MGSHNNDHLFTFIVALLLMRIIRCTPYRVWESVYYAKMNSIDWGAILDFTDIINPIMPIHYKSKENDSKKMWSSNYQRPILIWLVRCPLSLNIWFFQLLSLTSFIRSTWSKLFFILALFTQSMIYFKP